MNINLSIGNFDKNKKNPLKKEIMIPVDDETIETIDIGQTENFRETVNKIVEESSKNENELDKQNETTKNLLHEIESSIDNPEFMNGEEKKETTYKIPKEKMMLYLSNKTNDLSDKSTIYEYYYEDLNKVYNSLSITIIMLSSLITIIESTSLAELYSSDTENIIKVIIIALGFFITILSSIMKFFKFKDKIESIGKYMDNLNVLIDNIKIFKTYIQYGEVSDNKFYKKLKKISVIETQTNSSIFNIESDDYYKYYRKLRKIKSKKWDIFHSIKVNNDQKLNEFNSQKVDLLKQRLLLNSELQKIDKVVKEKKLDKFYESDLYTFSTNTNEE